MPAHQGLPLRVCPVFVTICAAIVRSRHGRLPRDSRSGSSSWAEGANANPYRMRSCGQTFRHRAQLVQSAMNSFPCTMPSAASEGHALMHAPHFVHLARSIRTRAKLTRSASHEKKPNGQIR